MYKLQGIACTSYKVLQHVPYKPSDMSTVQVLHALPSTAALQLTEVMSYTSIHCSVYS